MSADTPTMTTGHQAFRYMLLSALSFGLNLGLTVGLHEWAGLSSFLAVPIAMTLVTLFNFCTIKLFIFEGGGHHWLYELGGFVASIAVFRVAEYGVFLLIHGVLQMPYAPAYALILAGSTVCKFLFLRNVLFTPARKAVPA